MEAKYKILKNNYMGKTELELRRIFKQKKVAYDKMMKVLMPASYGVDFLNGDFPLWVKIAHLDEFLECPHCQAEYKERLAKKEANNENNG